MTSFELICSKTTIEKSMNHHDYHFKHAMSWIILDKKRKSPTKCYYFLLNRWWLQEVFGKTTEEARPGSSGWQLRAPHKGARRNHAVWWSTRWVYSLFSLNSLWS